MCFGPTLKTADHSFPEVSLFTTFHPCSLRSPRAHSTVSTVGCRNTFPLSIRGVPNLSSLQPLGLERPLTSLEASGGTLSSGGSYIICVCSLDAFLDGSMGTAALLPIGIGLTTFSSLTVVATPVFVEACVL
eukprot:GGOE01029230.1.p3 GENE.GGOE01029230.1~~GGOE01029230.1.p3  ORF type:complete len:132 (-),score=1.67 GGOE01029230.1:1066-1461(-)